MKKLGLLTLILSTVYLQGHEECCVPLCDVWHAEVDFLWWRADVEGVTFADVGSLIIPEPAQLAANTPIVANVKNRTPKGEYAPGVRVGIGYQFSEFNLWDLSLLWTHFTDKAKKMSFAAPISTNLNPGVSQLITPLGTTLLGPTAANASIHWKLYTNLLDLELGRDCSLGCNVSIKPHFGLRGAWFNFNSRQDFTGKWNFYGAVPIPTTLMVVEESTFFKADFTYRGIGIKAGADAEWRFSKQWSLLGTLAGSLLYGKYNIQQTANGFATDELLDTLPLILPLEIRLKKDLWLMRGDIEAFFGLKWETIFRGGRSSFSLAAGYEMSQWFQLNQIIDINDNYDIHTSFDENNAPFLASNHFFFEYPVNGNVSFQGLTVKGIFKY